MGYLYSLENHLKGFWDFYHATKVVLVYPKPIASFSVAKFRQKAKKKLK
jgi:hypothetical protein